MRWSCCCCFFSKTSVIHPTPPPSYSSTDATYIRIQSKKQKKKELDRTIYGGAAEHQIPDFRSDAWYLNRSTIKNCNFSYFAHRLINFDMNLWLDFDAAIEKRYRWCRTIDLLSLSLSRSDCLFSKFDSLLCGVSYCCYTNMTTSVCMRFTFGFRLPRIELMLNAKYGLLYSHKIFMSPVNFSSVVLFSLCLERFQQEQRQTLPKK